MTALPVLETARLRIRPFAPNDLDHARQLYTAIGWVNETQTPAEQLAVHRRYVQWNDLNCQTLADLRQPPTGDRVIERKSGGERIIAKTEYDNIASQRVMEKAGMRLEKNPFPDPFWFQVIGII